MLIQKMKKFEKMGKKREKRGKNRRQGNRKSGYQGWAIRLTGNQEAKSIGISNIRRKASP
ncbi:MAG: hypothetical protein CEE38_18530 [Planctomycetes bacterium B3_Pla]|nr:MAG: hypothetical protein CEE38_18530 [Planctomycetes bacterium B3_Pla]